MSDPLPPITVTSVTVRAKPTASAAVASKPTASVSVRAKPTISEAA